MSAVTLRLDTQEALLDALIERTRDVYTSGLDGILRCLEALSRASSALADARAALPTDAELVRMLLRLSMQEGDRASLRLHLRGALQQARDGGDRCPACCEPLDLPADDERPCPECLELRVTSAEEGGR